MSVHIVRVIASYPERQVVDCIDNDSYNIYAQKGLNVDSNQILRNVPYASSLATNYSMPYIWGVLSEEHNDEFDRHLDRYGPSFQFGKLYNPAYYREIHEKYYKGKGTNPKAVTGGVLFKVPEGSLGIYDTDTKAIVGFLSLSGRVAQSRSQYQAPNTKSAPDEFHSSFQEIFGQQEKDILDVLRVSSSSVGYDHRLTLEGDQNRSAIEETHAETVITHTFPAMSPSVHWQETHPAHVEPLSDAYIRLKQNEFKRLNEVYNLSTTGQPNKAKREETEVQGGDLLFENGVDFQPGTTTLSTANLSLNNPDIFENVVLSDDVTNGLFKYEEYDAHIVPESGIKHFDDGKIFIYADVYDSFADLAKPLNFEEFYSDESTFYSTRSTFKDIIKSSFDWLDSGEVDENMTYAFDEVDLKSADIVGDRQLAFPEDRGSYISVDPSFIELSSDSHKGGWFLSKTSKTYSITREYFKQKVYADYEVFRKGILNELLTFEHEIDSRYSWEILTDDNILEGTFALDAPLYAVRSFRQQQKAIESIVLEVDKSGSTSHKAGVYIGSMSTADSGDETVTSDGGCVLIRAGMENVSGGNLTSARLSPEANQGGRIVLDAHEIQLNCNRLLVGQQRIDQREKLTDLNLGAILLSLVPVEGSALQKIANLLFVNHPVNNRSALSSFSKKKSE